MYKLESKAQNREMHHFQPATDNQSVLTIYQASFRESNTHKGFTATFRLADWNLKQFKSI